MELDFVDLGLYLKREHVLVFSDFHLGYEEALQRKGVLIPRFQFKDTLKRLDRIFISCQKKKYKIETIIINGDLKHEFGRISDQEWREILKLMDFLLEHCEKLVIIQGNHDVILSPIVKKRLPTKKVFFEKWFLLDDILFAHGDVLPEKLFGNKKNGKMETDMLHKRIKTIIMGNEHPALALQEKGRVERFKCFLKGKWKGKTLIVLPSFQLLTTGTDILREKLLSPYLHQDLRNFECWIVSDEGKVFAFGKLKNIRKL